MKKEEYMRQLKKKLKRLPKEDFERAVEYYEEYFAEAEDEEKAIEELGPVQEAAHAIICDMACGYAKEPAQDMKKGMDALWVAVLAVFAAPVALPLLCAGAAVVFSVLLAIAMIFLAAALADVGIVIAGVFAAVASFSVLAKSVPVFLTCLGAGIFCCGAGLLAGYAVCGLWRMFIHQMVKLVGMGIKRRGDR